MRHILVPFPRCPSVTERISLVCSCSRWHVRIVASNSRKTNYKWRTGTRLLDSRDGFVTGLPSLFGHSRFDLRPLSVTWYVYWISSDTLAWRRINLDARRTRV